MEGILNDNPPRKQGKNRLNVEVIAYASGYAWYSMNVLGSRQYRQFPKQTDGLAGAATGGTDLAAF